MSNKTQKAAAAKTGSAPKYKQLFIKLLILGVLIVAAGVVGSRHAQISLRLGARSFEYETARTQAEQEKGLSDRTSLPKNRAMVFAFDQPAIQCFWMKDMNFPIDMIWLDANKTIIHIEQNVQPNTYPHAFCPHSPAKYVVEVNANTSAEAGIKVGDQVSF